jgi:hypothetical protein
MQMQGPGFIPKAVLTTGRVLHQPFEVPTEMTKSALLQGGVSHALIGEANRVAAKAVEDLQPRGPAKLLSKLFGRVDQSLTQSAEQAKLATEVFWVPFSNGAHQVGHAVSNPFSMFYAKRAGFEAPADPGELQAMLAQITDPDPESTKFPGFNWPTPAPAEEPPPAEKPAEDPPSQQPAEEPAGGQPTGEQPTGEQPAGEQPATASDQPAPTGDEVAAQDAPAGPPASDAADGAPAEGGEATAEIRSVAPNPAADGSQPTDQPVTDPQVASDQATVDAVAVDQASTAAAATSAEGDAPASAPAPVQDAAAGTEAVTTG